MRVLMVPGLGGSGADHWQTLWERELGGVADRLRPGSWDAPEQADWFDALEGQAGADTFLVAHSLGCLAVSAWLADRGPDAAVGAFLVAPPDRDAEHFPPEARSFHPAPAALPVPVTVVASSNDPYAELEEARTLARRWGAAFVEAGAVGHINAASGLGGWDAGRAELNAALASLRLGPSTRALLRVARADVHDGDVRQLVEEHLRDLYATSPAESVHALPLTELADPGITLWAARDDADTLLGIAALKHLPAGGGELKSMRTGAHARNTGVAAQLLRHVVGEAMARGYDRLLLETGTQDYFASARRLYAKTGFREVEPFADYRPDPNSVYMGLELDPHRPPVP